MNMDYSVKWFQSEYIDVNDITKSKLLILQANQGLYRSDVKKGNIW